MTVSLLASHEDDVLKIAFTIGDPFADLLHDDRTPFRPALGYNGPVTPAPAQILAPWQIADACGYGHSKFYHPMSTTGGRKSPISCA